LESRGAPIPFGGQQVHSIYRFEVVTRAAVRVTFVRADPSVREALRFKIEGGDFVVRGQVLKDVVLWSDTAPRDSDIDVLPTGSGCLVKVWNAWADENCIMQAWIGNGGMVIEEHAGWVRLRCSDGVGAPDFNDLVVDLAVE